MTPEAAKWQLFGLLGYTTPVQWGSTHTVGWRPLDEILAAADEIERVSREAERAEIAAMLRRRLALADAIPEMYPDGDAAVNEARIILRLVEHG